MSAREGVCPGQCLAMGDVWLEGDIYPGWFIADGGVCIVGVSAWGDICKMPPCGQNDRQR